jgi:hypothetical protein
MGADATPPPGILTTKTPDFEHPDDQIKTGRRGNLECGR